VDRLPDHIAAQEAAQRFAQRLENWVLVAASRRWQSSTSGSAEGRYVPEKLTAAEDQIRRQPRIPLDVLDGWEVERAWRSIEHLPYRLCLAYHYHRKFSPGKICRLLRIHYRRFDETLRKARGALRNLLAARETRLLASSPATNCPYDRKDLETRNSEAPDRDST
jgi:DNA-directed RNA polymerase specialized sigma24 family protein